jgi:hypothetical protein
VGSEHEQLPALLLVVSCSQNPAGQLLGRPTHCPCLHWSFDVQGLLSEQGNVSLRYSCGGQKETFPQHLESIAQSPTAGKQIEDVPLKISGGQVAALPEQDSATSQGPAEERQVMAFVRKAVDTLVIKIFHSGKGECEEERSERVILSVGHWVPWPSQNSGTSHIPLSGLHINVEFWIESPGQNAEPPVQFSAISQPPADALHMAVVLMKASGGHPTLVPSQNSTTSHVLPLAKERQMWELGYTESDGHAVEVPVQVSATSQVSAEGRHTVPELWYASAGHEYELPVQRSATSQVAAPLTPTTAALQATVLFT